MRTVLGLSVVALLCVMAYQFVRGLFAKRIYFKKPLEVIETGRITEEVYFHVSSLEKIKKLIVPVIALTMMITLSIESQTVIIFFVMVGVPALFLYYWLAGRLGVFVSKDNFTIRYAKEKERKVYLGNINQIELRYDYVKRLVEPRLIFYSEIENIEIPLPQAYFLEKSTAILMALKQRCPAKTILFTWSVPKKNTKEVMEIQKGTLNKLDFIPDPI